MDSFYMYLGHRNNMYTVSSKSGSKPCRTGFDLTWNDPVVKVNQDRLYSMTRCVCAVAKHVHVKQDTVRQN